MTCVLYLQNLTSKDILPLQVPVSTRYITFAYQLLLYWLMFQCGNDKIIKQWRAEGTEDAGGSEEPINTIIGKVKLATVCFISNERYNDIQA